MIDGGRFQFFGFNLYIEGILGPLIGETHDITGVGGAEKEGLALIFVRCGVDDLSDVGNKSHIEHAVGFIDDENLDP